MPSTISRPAATGPVPFYLKMATNQARCNSPFAESPLWETIVRNVYISFRENITQWDDKSLRPGGYIFMLRAFAGPDGIVCGRIAYGIA